jgi:hypothetical protein
MQLQELAAGAHSTRGGQAPSPTKSLTPGPGMCLSGYAYCSKLMSQGCPRPPASGPWPALLQAEALAVKDGQLEQVSHLGGVGVLWQQQRVEAGVAGGQLGAVRAVALDDALEGAQATDGAAVAACGEGGAGGWAGCRCQAWARWQVA